MLPSSTATPYLGQASGRTQSFHDMSNSLYPVAPARQSYPSGYYGHLENSSFQQYDMQSSRQTFPLHMSQAPSPGYPSSDLSSNWVPLSTNSRSQYSGLSFDQDVSSSYPPSAFPYSATAGAAINAGGSERSSNFPGLSPLVTHLPVRGTNRILPNPTSLHSAFDSSNGSAHEGDNDMGLFQQHLNKTSDSWDLNRVTTGTSQGSVSSAVHDTICASGSTSSTSSSSSSDSQEPTNFGYINLTHPTAIESIASNPLNPDAYSGNTASDIPSSRRRASQLPSIDRPHYLWNAPVSVGMSANPLMASGSSASGQSASRILQPQPRHTPSYDVLRGSYETNSHPRGKVLKSNVNPSRGKR